MAVTRGLRDPALAARSGPVRLNARRRAPFGVGLGNLFFSAPLPFRVSLVAVGIWFALTILDAVIATEAAATRASHTTVREALAYV
jgi:hypothetical protein